jgi:hypothetical protein
MCAEYSTVGDVGGIGVGKKDFSHRKSPKQCHVMGEE